MEILKSGDHLIGKENIYIVIPHLNGHRRVRLYCRTKQEYAGDVFSIMDYTPMKEIEKHLNEKKLILIKSEQVRDSQQWFSKIKGVREKIFKIKI